MRRRIDELPALVRTFRVEDRIRADAPAEVGPGRMRRVRRGRGRGESELPNGNSTRQRHGGNRREEDGFIPKQTKRFSTPCSWSFSLCVRSYSAGATYPSVECRRTRLVAHARLIAGGVPLVVDQLALHRAEGTPDHAVVPARPVAADAADHPPRRRQLVALARVTASAFGQSAPGVIEARERLAT